MKPGILLQVDADEFWTPTQMRNILFAFDDARHLKWARFDCDYYVGPNIVTVTQGAYGHNAGEWLRAFRFQPGMQFLKHEPPVLDGVDHTYAPFGLSREETRRRGLVFQHYPYLYPEQVRAKEDYYGYKDAVAQWHRLQQNKVWPVKLKKYLSWSDDRAMADLVH